MPVLPTCICTFTCRCVRSTHTHTRVESVSLSLSLSHALQCTLLIYTCTCTCIFPQSSLPAMQLLVKSWKELTMGSLVCVSCSSDSNWLRSWEDEQISLTTGTLFSVTVCSTWARGREGERERKRERERETDRDREREWIEVVKIARKRITAEASPPCPQQYFLYYKHVS